MLLPEWYKQTKMTNIYSTMSYRETLNTLEKTWWGHDSQARNVEEQLDAVDVYEGLSRTWISGVTLVWPLPSRVLVPPRPAELYNWAVNTRGR